MATSIYKSGYVELIDGTEIYITPLKLKYLREFMIAFENVKSATNEDEALIFLLECIRIGMKQYHPSLMTIYQIEDAIDIKAMYKILEYSADIHMNPDSDKEIQEEANSADSSWDKLDLADLESEVFLLGIWKDYEELEISISMPELVAILDAKRKRDYDEKKFLAAIQGIDLDEKTGNSKQNAWEEMKARVFSRGKTSDPNDVTSLQGINAQKAGFGIGMGLDYEDLTKKK